MDAVGAAREVAETSTTAAATGRVSKRKTARTLGNRLVFIVMLNFFVHCFGLLLE